VDLRALRAVHFALERLRYEAGLVPPLTVAVTDELRANTQVRPHALSTCDRLHAENDGGTDVDR